MFERFTDRARRALVEAQSESAENGHGFLGTEHILIGLMRLGDGLAHDILVEHGVALEPLREKSKARLSDIVHTASAQVSQRDALASIGIDLDSVRSRIEETFGPGTLPDPVARPPFTPKAKEALERAYRRSRVLRHRYVGTEHELLGVLELRDGLACQALQDLGVDVDALDAAVVARTAPDQLRFDAAWKTIAELRAGIHQLDDDQQTQASGPMSELTRRLLRAINTEQAEVNRLAAEAADELEAAVAQARSDLADLGISPP